MDFPRILRSRDIFKFWQTIDNISETVQDTDIVRLQWKSNKKSYVSYRMAPIPIALYGLWVTSAV